MKQNLGRHRASGKEPGLGLKRLEASLPLRKEIVWLGEHHLLRVSRCSELVCIDCSVQARVCGKLSAQERGLPFWVGRHQCMAGQGWKGDELEGAVRGGEGRRAGRASRGQPLITFTT